ncbi:hypothetical protein IWX76_001265 [Pedobacter sp. CAN_A7]
MQLFGQFLAIGKAYSERLVNIAEESEKPIRD